MRASEAGRGLFANRFGGLGRWREFRIAFGNVGPFHGQVTNAGLVCLRTESSLRGVMLSDAKHLWLISVEHELSNIAPRLKAWARGLRLLRCSFASLRMTV